MPHKISANTMGKWVSAIAAITLLLAAEPLLAQPNAQTKPAGPGGVELTVETVQGRLKEVEETPDLDEEAKKKLIELYKQALDDLRRADEWASKAADFVRARDEAPGMLEAARQELAKPIDEPKPETQPGDTLQQLELRLSQAEAELKSEQEQARRLEEEQKRRGERRAKAPEAAAAAKKQLQEALNQLGAPPVPGESSELAQAKQTALSAQKRALEEEIHAYKEETASCDARGELLTALRDQAARRVSRAEALVKAYQAIVNESRRVEAQRAAKAAEQARRDAARAHPVVRKLAEENAELARQRARDRLADRIQQATQQYDEVTKALAELSADFKSVESKVQAAGLTNAVGLLLRRQRADLPRVRQYRRAIAARQAEISHAQLRLIELEEARADLADIEPAVKTILNGLDPAIRGFERDEIERAVRDKLQEKRGYVDSLRGDYDSYFVKLVDLDAEQRKLIAQVEEFADYIDQRIFWIRSSSTPGLSDLSETREAVRWLTYPGNWSAAVRSIWPAARAKPVPAALGLPILGALLLMRRRLTARLRHIGKQASKGYALVFFPTIRALLLTILIAATWPALIWFVAWLLGSSLDAPEFSKAVAVGLQALAMALFTAEFVRQTCLPTGLAQAHFGWPARGLRLIRRHLLWLMATGLPLVFIVAVIEWTDRDDWQNSLGRFAFILGQILLAVFAQRVLRPVGGAPQEVIAADPAGWLYRSRYVWYPAAVGLPLTSGALALAGYYYTVLHLAKRMNASLWLVLAIALANALALRWLAVSRRRLAIEQARKRRAAQAGEKEERPPTPAEQSPEQELDLSAISAQTQRLLRVAVVVALVAGLWVVWVDVLPALAILDKVELWWTTAKVLETVTDAKGNPVMRWEERNVPVTLADLILAALILLMTVVAAKNVPGLLEITLLQRLGLRPAGRYVITTLSRYLITIVGLVVAFGAIRIGWSKVQWLAAAITVGLGFGLQEIFANFVSGLIILFEQPVRVGDTVTVGDVSGEVTRIRMRATTITNWDRKELVIPNKEFVTGQVINWTLSDTTLRVVIPVGIAYGSDTALAESLLTKVAQDNPLVLDDPQPMVLFMAFGESSLDFELRVFVSDISHFLQVRHMLHRAVDAAFRKAGIEIAFPQRDLHIRSVKDVFPISERPSKYADPQE